VDSCGKALHIFISTLIRILYVMSSHFSAQTFAQVSQKSELRTQADISICGKERELIK